MKSLIENYKVLLQFKQTKTTVQYLMVIPGKCYEETYIIIEKWKTGQNIYKYWHSEDASEKFTSLIKYWGMK